MPNDHNHDPFSPDAAVRVEPTNEGYGASTSGSGNEVSPPAPSPASAGESEPVKETFPAGTAVPTAEGSDVPEGTVKEVLAWVGDDKDKAQRALDAENATGDPRKSLVAELEERLA